LGRVLNALVSILCLNFMWIIPISHAATITYTYDTCVGSTYSYGRLCRVNDTSGYTTFSYEEMGRINQTTKKVNGDATLYTTATTYDDAGRILTLDYPDGSGVVNYDYQGAALKRVYKGGTTYVEYSNFNEAGQAKTAQYGNNTVTSTYTYAEPGTSCPLTNNYRLCSLTTQQNGGTVHQQLTYTYDNVGNILKITDSIIGDQDFVYGDLDRLNRAESSGTYGIKNYAYDTIGNMTTKDHNGALTTYSYPTNGIRPHAVTSAGANSYQYDANGNMTSGAGRTITYDSENRPIQVTANSQTTDIVYDGDGGRVKKTVNGTTTLYIGKLYECTDGVCKRYIYSGGTRIAQVPTNNTSDIRYYHGDHLGSSSVITLADGSLDKRYTYHPYGETYPETNWSGDNVHHKFTGQELDDSTGLYFYGARYYDPILAKFISPDTFIQAPGNPQNLNRYSYVLNNPIIYTDPSGNFFQIIVAVAVAAAVGAAIGAAINVTIAAINGQDLGRAAVAGAVAGAIMGPTMSIGAPYAAAGLGPMAGLAVAAAGGAAAGAASSASVGGDIGRGALAGAAGAAAGHIAGPLAAGAAGAAAVGGDPLKGALMAGATATAVAVVVYSASAAYEIATRQAKQASRDIEGIKPPAKIQKDLSGDVNKFETLTGSKTNSWEMGEAGYNSYPDGLERATLSWETANGETRLTLDMALKEGSVGPAWGDILVNGNKVAGYSFSPPYKMGFSYDFLASYGENFNVTVRIPQGVNDTGGAAIKFDCTPQGCR